MAIYMN